MNSLGAKYCFSLILCMLLTVLAGCANPNWGKVDSHGQPLPSYQGTVKSIAERVGPGPSGRMDKLWDFTIETDSRIYVATTDNGFVQDTYQTGASVTFTIGRSDPGIAVIAGAQAETIMYLGNYYLVVNQTTQK